MDAAEEGRESPEFVLFPFIKRMIVTLSALQMDAEKCSRRCRSQVLGADFFSGEKMDGRCNDRTALTIVVMAGRRFRLEHRTLGKAQVALCRGDKPVEDTLNRSSVAS